MGMTSNEAADLFRRNPDRFVEVGGAEVAVRSVGSGPDVLFVHGWPVNGATFRRLLPHLVDHVTCHVIDLPGAGSSRFASSSTLTLDGHIAAVPKVADALGLSSVAVVGHDSGGMIARHAMAGDPRLRAMGLIDTEPTEVGWRFTSFLMMRRAPGLSGALGWVAGHRGVYRNKWVFGDAFADRSFLDDEFDEFFIRPLHADAARRAAAASLLRSFDYRYISELAGIHRRIGVPVRLVWGERDRFFPVADARAMVSSFPDASLVEIAGAGLFSHEERAADVAAALVPVLTAEG